MVVQVQTILHASTALSLFALFLVMVVVLRWFPECALVNTQGPSIEHSQNRQWKLDRIDHVVESLPFMLQAALLLRGCALSRYLLETNPTVASVIINLTFLSALVYLYIAIVGVVFPTWSYQTPRTRNPSRLVHIPGLLYSVFSTSVRRSACLRLLPMVWDGFWECRRSNRRPFPKEPGVIRILLHVFLLPVYLSADVTRLCIAITLPFTGFARRVYFRLRQGSEHQTAMSDLQCISWTLRTSLDVPARLSAMNCLTTIMPAHFDVTLVIDCFDTLIGCVNIINDKVTIVQGLEQLAEVSTLCCLHTLSHLTVADMVLSVEDVRQRYAEAFPPEANFDGLPFSHILGAIHTIFYQTHKFRVVLPTHMDQITLITWRARLTPRNRWWESSKLFGEQTIFEYVLRERARRPWRVQWEKYKPSGDEQIVVASALAKLARFEYRRRGHRKVPRWLLRFAFHSLSQQPLPPASVLIDCLSIIAIDLGCNFLESATPHKRCVYT